MNQSFTIALVGTPNVGKSTLFNRFCSPFRRQHTGNWAGKTVGAACTSFTRKGVSYRLCDLPGIYSLQGDTPEQKLTVDYLLHGDYDAVICVADACAPTRGLSLLLQVLPLCKKTVLCLNLADTARRQGICIDASKLSFLLGIPVVLTEAQKNKGLSSLPEIARAVCAHPPKAVMHPLYPKEVNAALRRLLPDLIDEHPKQEALRRLCADPTLAPLIEAAPIQTADRLIVQTVTRTNTAPPIHLLDRILTGRVSGTLCILLFLLLILFLTVSGATCLSDALAFGFDLLRRPIEQLLSPLPPMLYSFLLDGIYRVVSFVVSVMLPPLVIFFPLFRLLEEVGFLPRLAYKLDPILCKAGTGGKQALTVCMGLGCNAVGVTGCRIIGDQKERDCAMLTNTFTPCNGKLPLLILLLSFCGMAGKNDLLTALGLCLLLLFSFGMTFLCTWLMQKCSRGKSEALILELPQWRTPKLTAVFFSEVVKKTLQILSRAVVGALFAGILLWLLGHITLGETTLLQRLIASLDPIGSFFALDGEIFAAFLLGFPANEIVLPILLMAYTDQTVPVAATDAVGQILSQNGWTLLTVLNMMLLTLMHAPCLTTLLTVYKESKSIKKTLLAIGLPTLFGLGCCLLLRGMFWIFG